MCYYFYLKTPIIGKFAPVYTMIEWWSMKGEAVQLHSFLDLALGGISRNFHGSSFSPKVKSPVAIEQETEWTPNTAIPKFRASNNCLEVINTNESTLKLSVMNWVLEMRKTTGISIGIPLQTELCKKPTSFAGISIWKSLLTLKKKNFLVCVVICFQKMWDPVSSWGSTLWDSSMK